MQKDITNWAKETFGAWVSVRDAWDRFLDEEKEAWESLINKKELTPELVDMLHIMFQIADYEGYDLLAETAKKFEVNKNRKWKITGNGVGQHVEN